MGCVYRIFCLINGKSYIGQTTQNNSPAYRWKRHLRDALRYNSQLPFHAAIRKHGSNAFRVETLFVSDSHYILNKLEALYADCCNAYLWGVPDDGVPPGYNACLAGVPNRMQNVRHTPEARAKISEASKRRWAAHRLRQDDLSGNPFQQFAAPDRTKNKTPAPCRNNEHHRQSTPTNSSQQEDSINGEAFDVIEHGTECSGGEGVSSPPYREDKES